MILPDRRKSSPVEIIFELADVVKLLRKGQLEKAEYLFRRFLEKNEIKLKEDQSFRETVLRIMQRERIKIITMLLPVLHLRLD